MTAPGAVPAPPPHTPAPPRPDRPGRLAAAGACCVLAATALLLVGPMGLHRERWITVVLAAWAVFGLSAWWVLRAQAPRPGRAAHRALAVVVVVSALCQLPGLLSKPLSSDDAYRYVWDGRVQLAGISPYRYAPGDDALAFLRDPVLFPGLGPEEAGGLSTVREFPRDRAARFALIRDDPRTEINRPRAVTIYPPAAQAWFLLVAAVTPWSAGTLGIQVGSALLAVLTTALIGWVLLRRDRDPRWALLWGWAPVTAHEAGNNGHVDVLAAAAIIAAVAALTWRSGVLGRVLCGVALGVAISAKLLPLALLPAVTPLRQRWRTWVAAPVAVLTAAASYLPYLAGAGVLVLGYLPAYLGEEGFEHADSTKYAVLTLLQVPGPWRTPLALAVLAVVAVVVAWRATAGSTAEGAVVLLGTTLLVLTPSYPWYSLPVVALAALARRPEWLVVALPPTLGNSVASGGQLLAAWGVAAAVVVVVGVWRAGRARQDGGGPGRTTATGPREPAVRRRRDRTRCSRTAP